MTTLRDRLVHHVENAIKHHTERRAKFANEFAENPSHALIWGEYIFEAEAALVVYNWNLHALKYGKVSVIAADLERTAMRRAASRASSTSVLSNLMADYERIAHVNLLDIVRRVQRLDTAGELEVEVEA